MYISKNECRKSGGKWDKKSGRWSSIKKGFEGRCVFAFEQYELHAGYDDGHIYLVTEEDRSVGIFGVQVSHGFKSLKNLNKWFKKHENEFAEINEISNDKLYWKRMQSMVNKR